jgi:hypothetical protein
MTDADFWQVDKEALTKVHGVDPTAKKGRRW